MNLSKKMYFRIISIVCFILLLVGISYLFRYRNHGNDLNFFYTTNESKIYSQQFKNSVDDTKVSNCIVSMPLHSNNNNNIGMLYSDAIIFETDKPNIHDVMQTVNYIFNGTDPNFPKGSIFLRIYFENNNSNIFPPNNMYTAHIISGSGAYVNATGIVNLNVNNDERNAIIHFTHM